MAIGKDEIINRWGHHPPTEVTKPKHDRIRQAYIELALLLDEELPDGRGKSLAFTDLQNSSMWANFSVAELASAQAPTYVKGSAAVPYPSNGPSAYPRP